MNKLYISTLFILFLLHFHTTRASHLAGGEMNYKYLGNNEYLITAIIYRDCRGVAFSNPTIGVFGGNNGGNACFSTTLSASRISIKDITPRCSTASSPCSPQNTPSSEGIEEHVYTFTVDISKSPFAENIAKSSCGDITFYAMQCCRTGAITTGPAGNDFAVTLTIKFGNLKKCPNKVSSSPAFHKGPRSQFLCCNSPVHSNTGGEDPDGDLVRYKLTPALSGLPMAPVNYASPFSYQYPFTPYCVPPTTIKCAPNITVVTPRGIYLDSNSGLFIFVPAKCDEVFVAAIKCSEYRKDSSGNYVLIAYVTRDLQYIVKDDCGYNKPPKISGLQSVYTVREGDTLRLSFDVKDETFSPYQTIPDTPVISWWDSVAGQKLTVLNPTSREKTYQFEWITKKGDFWGIDRLVRLTANDRNCPKPFLHENFIRVRFQGKGDSMRFVSETDKCGAINLTAITTPKDNSQFFWRIIDSISGDTVSTSNGASWTAPMHLRGTHRIELSASNGTYYFNNFSKNITFNDDYFHAEIGNDTAICQGNNLKIEPVVFRDLHATKYVWHVLEGAKLMYTDSSQNLILNSPLTGKNVHLTISDSIGCAHSSQLKIAVLGIPKLDLGNDVTHCSELEYTIATTPDTTMEYLWNTGNTTNTLVVKQSGTYSLTVTNALTCSKTDTVNVVFVPQPKVSINPANVFCQDNKYVDLNSLLWIDSLPAQNNKANYSTRKLDNTHSNPVALDHFFDIHENVKGGTWTVDYKIPVSGCPDITGNFNVVLNYKPDAQFTTDPNLLYNFDVFDILFKPESTIPDNSKLRYNWNLDRFKDDTAHFSNDTTIVYPKTSAGYHPKLIVISDKGCIDSTTRNLNIIVAINDLDEKEFIINPDLVLMDMAFSKIEWAIYDGSGRKLLSLNNNLGLLANGVYLPAGIYFYRVQIGAAEGTKKSNGKLIVPH